MFKLIIDKLFSKRGSTEEADGDDLAKEAYAEMEAEAKGEPIPTPEAKPKEEKPEEAKEEDGEPEAKPEDTDSEEETEDSEEEQTEDDDSTPEKEDDEDLETEPETEDRDTQITKHAEKQSMTYAEAKEDIEKTEKIVSQFKNDPKEMARALRSKDREYDKLRNEFEKKKEEKPLFKPLTEDQFAKVARERIEQNPDDAIAAYQKKYPAKSEMMSDEAIIEDLTEKLWVDYQQKASVKSKEMAQDAQKTRDDFITSIPEQDKRFIPEVKALLTELDDRSILQEDFDPGYLIQLAKGKAYDVDIKKAKEDALKRGKEDPKILGAKTGGGKQRPKGKVKSGLTQSQKERAEEMYPDADGYAPEKAHQMFKETYEKELKQNPSFV